MLNPIKTGKFIANKRKEKNLTQEQLADKISVTNKAISKWENGKCLPDYSVVESLCVELGCTLDDLLKGETQATPDKNTIDLLQKIQHYQEQKHTFRGAFLTLFAITLSLGSKLIGGTPFQEFISGLLLGLALPISLFGVLLLLGILPRK